jgi:hypothetical protein
MLGKRIGFYSIDDRRLSILGDCAIAWSCFSAGRSAALSSDSRPGRPRRARWAIRFDRRLPASAVNPRTRIFWGFLRHSTLLYSQTTCLYRHYRVTFSVDFDSFGSSGRAVLAKLDSFRYISLRRHADVRIALHHSVAHVTGQSKHGTLRRPVFRHLAPRRYDAGHESGA